MLCTCSYVPEEIIVAAGLVPKRIIPGARPSGADAHMHPNTCSYVRSVLASALAGDVSKASGIVIANSCDGMRRLHDLWNAYVADVPALFLDVPKKSDPVSVEYFASELKRFASQLEARCGGSRVTEARLAGAIRECNEVRGLMGDVFRLQRNPLSNVSGSAVHELFLRGIDSHPTAFADEIRGFISARAGQEALPKGARIALTGGVVHRLDLIECIETSGGRVVVLNTCPGARHYEMLVAENSPDPMVALAERYLQKPSCARMEGIEERFQHLRRLASDSAADGVIYVSVKFCDTYLYEIPLMRATCEDAGIPFLAIESDYEWTGLEQMRTRVEAFLAVAGERRSG
jgi:benzoyl-CoA reductase/2-hydroxyglutaryl-CoA dehydratase subunit BcrC/BadD/HgdB